MAFTSVFIPKGLTAPASTTSTSITTVRSCSATPIAAAKKVSRRSTLSIAAAAAATAALSTPLIAPPPAHALDVVQYVDLPKGFKMLRPSGWNEFSATPDQYDIKWQDVIQPLEFVTVLTSPTGTKSLESFGSVDAVGEKLAAKRAGELVGSTAKDIDGIPAYVIEIKRGNAHQLTLLTVNKQKLYAVTASADEKRWGKREKLLRGVVDSFQPKL